MIDIRTEIDKLDIRRIQRDLNQIEPAVTTAFEEVASELAQVWRITGIAEAAYLTGAYVGAIRSKRVSAREFLVSTESNKEVIYSDIIERGRRDTPNYQGRFVLEKAIERYDQSDRVESRIDEQLDKELKK